MKKIIFIMAAAALCSCAKQQGAGPERTDEAVFSVGFGGTRAAHNYVIGDYFSLGGELEKISVLYGQITYTYSYDSQDDLLKGGDDADIIRFPQDGSPLTHLELTWPAKGVVDHENGVVRDQSRRDKFLSMDILYGQTANVMPTTVIPIVMRHTRSKITFAMGGAHEGKRIESLEIGDFKAYCDPAVRDAQLIYDQARDAGSLAVGMLGKVKVEGVAAPIPFALADSPDSALGASPGNYTITLTL